MNKHHPELDQLMEYSAGTIDPSIGLCISVHLEYCEQCRLQLGRLDAIGGLMMNELPEEEVDPGLLDNIFARIDAKTTSSAGKIDYKLEQTDNVPTSVKKLVGYDLEQLQWRRHGANVKSAQLIQHAGVKASLIRIKRGAQIPQHGHKGKEYTIILDGAFSDKDGIYQQGDFLVREAGETHSPTATTDKDCLCLAVLEAPLHFQNPLVEMFNKLMPL